MALGRALRSLKRSPAFTLTVILTLALGIACVGSMFAVVYGVLLAPLPYGEPARLVSVRLTTAEADDLWQPPALQVTYDRLARTLVGVGFHRTGSTNVWTQGSSGAADSVVATWVSASTIPLLQVAPVLGRSFTEEEELRGGPDAVILSESEWRSRFNAAPEVIGKTLMVNSVAREIIGVMPSGFSFPSSATRIWLPAKRVDNASVGDFSYSGVARLAPGASLEQAQRELQALLPRMAESFPRLESPRVDRAQGRVPAMSTAQWLAEVRPTPVLVPLQEEITQGITGPLWMLAAAAGLVLLVAWANVTNLLLIRADARQPEVAIRAALGADRRRTAATFLAEAVVLGAPAGAIAVILVQVLVTGLVAFGPIDIPRLAQLRVGSATLAFIALVTATGVMLCTAVPASRLWRAPLSLDLREGGRGTSTGKSRTRLRAAIAILQIAVALAVTIGSALLLRSAHGLSQVHPGFAPAQVLTLRTQLPAASYRDASAVAFHARLIERVRRLPSVHQAGLTMKLPLGAGATLQQSFRVHPAAKTQSHPIAIVDAGYFAAMSIPLLAGRSFRPLGLDHGRELVISRQAAAALFDDPVGTTSVGKRLTLMPGELDYTIVGIVGDVRDQDLAIAPSDLIYRPLGAPVDPDLEPGPPLNMALVVKSSGATGELLSAIRRIVLELDPAVAVYHVQPLDDVLGASTARRSLVLGLSMAATATTLMLGGIGLYGVMACLIALRAHEFGVRVALGAPPSRIATLVATRALVLTASGIAGGLVLHALLAPFLRAFLFGVTATDPATLAGATLALLCTAALASWLPARCAAGVDPARALRAE